MIRQRLLAKSRLLSRNRSSFLKQKLSLRSKKMNLHRKLHLCQTCPAKSKIASSKSLPSRRKTTELRARFAKSSMVNKLIPMQPSWAAKVTPLFLKQPRPLETSRTTSCGRRRWSRSSWAPRRTHSISNLSTSTVWAWSLALQATIDCFSCRTLRASTSLWYLKKLAVSRESRRSN